MATFPVLLRLAVNATCALAGPVLITWRFIQDDQPVMSGLVVRPGRTW